MHPSKKCEYCGATASLKQITHEEVIGTVRVQMPSVMTYHCDACGEDDLSLDQLVKLQQQAAITALKDMPKIDGKTFRGIRKVLGVTQAQLAAFLGVASETVSRWESGTLEVSRPAQVGLLSASMLVQEGCSLAVPDAPTGPLVSPPHTRCA